MEVFRQMGRAIRERWRKQQFDERVFPDIALAALREFSPAERTTHGDVIEAWLFDASLPVNRASGDFGEPAITVYDGERFYVEVLCWMDGTTMVHQHGFSGAFHVMDGSSLHSTYCFVERNRIDSQMRLGDVLFRGCELLAKGESRAIRAGAGLIHALFHLDRPSISVVVRTPTEQDHLPQWMYQPPHLALDPFHPERKRRERLRKTLAVVAAVNAERYDRLVDRIVAEGDLSLVYAAILDCLVQAAAEPPRIDQRRVGNICDAVRLRFGPAGDELVASCRAELRTAELQQQRADVHDPELRLFLALLLNVPTQAAIFDVLARQFRADPVALVQSWLRRLTRTVGGGAVALLDVEVELERPPAGVSLDEFLHRVIGAMLAGARGPDLVQEVEPSFPPGAVASLADAIASLEAMLLDGSLAPLFTGSGAGRAPGLSAPPGGAERALR